MNTEQRKNKEIANGVKALQESLKPRRLLRDSENMATEQRNETSGEFCICEEHTNFKDDDCEDCKREWEYFSTHETT